VETDKTVASQDHPPISGIIGKPWVIGVRVGLYLVPCLFFFLHIRIYPLVVLCWCTDPVLSECIMTSLNMIPGWKGLSDDKDNPLLGK
jgi:hypothetical protein